MMGTQQRSENFEGVVSLVLPFLYARDLCHMARVSKEVSNAIKNNDTVWRVLCTTSGFNEGYLKLTSHTWKDVYKQMISHDLELRAEGVRYQVRFDAWRERMLHMACGMRGSPPKPKFITLDSVKPRGGLYGGFKAHPSSKIENVLPFSTNLVEIAKVYLDLLVEARKYKQFHDPDFLAQALQRYVNFLHLKHKYKNTVLIPTLEIEYVWVSHMLRPQMYINDCTAMFGEVIDHSIMLTTPYHCLNKAYELQETRDLYYKEFQLQYCSDSTIEKQRNVPHFNTSGIAPLHPPDRETPNKGEYFGAPKVSTPIRRAPAFVGDLGISSKTTTRLSIGLKVNDLLMDEMWIGEFERFMKPAIASPLNTDEILLGKESYGNPCKMAVVEVYKYIWKAYEKFLYMAAKFPPGKGEYIHPSYAIDVVWHAHMLCPKIYAKETSEWVGYLVDHEPWPSCEKIGIHKSIDHTEDLWKKEFGQSLIVEHVTRVVESEKDNWRISYGF